MPVGMQPSCTDSAVRSSSSRDNLRKALVTDAIAIPDDLKPADGRFGAGPSKIPTSALDALAATGTP